MFVLYRLCAKRDAVLFEQKRPGVYLEGALGFVDDDLEMRRRAGEFLAGTDTPHRAVALQISGSAPGLVAKEQRQQQSQPKDRMKEGLFHRSKKVIDYG